MPEQDVLAKFISKKHYDGKMVNELSTRLSSDKNLYDKALTEMWETSYSDMDKNEFMTQYTAKYGDPFKKKSLPPTGEDSKPGLPADIPPLQEGVTGTDEFVSPEMNAVDQREQAAPPVVTPEEQSRTSSALGTINQRFYGLPGEVMKAVAIGGSKIGGLIEGQELDATENPLYKAGQWYQDKIAEIAPNNPEYQGELQESVATAIGDLAGLVTGGGIARTAGKASQLALLAEKYGMPVKEAATQLAKGLISPEGIIGATQMGVSEYEQAKASGATEEQAVDQFIKNAAVGSVLERIPVQLFWKRLDTATGGGVKNMLKAGFSGGIEEGTTEIMQQAYSNITARESYDKTRKIIDGMGESGGIGFGLGFVLNAMGVRLRKVKETATTEEDIKAVDKAIAYVEQKQAEVESTNQQDNEIQRSNEELRGTDNQLLGGADIPVPATELGDSGVSQNQSDVVENVPPDNQQAEVSELGETVAPNENMSEQEIEPPALTDAIYQAQGLTKVKLGDITYTDDNGNPCAKMGGRGDVFTKGSQWEVVADLSGYPSHAHGGVDIKFDKDGYMFGGKIKAAHGLVLPCKKK